MVKRNGFHKITRYKDRLVAQGFSQRPGIGFEELYAPVVRHDSLRLLMSLAVQNGWSPMQLEETPDLPPLQNRPSEAPLPCRQAEGAYQPSAAHS